jgi:hypothetical protein
MAVSFIGGGNRSTPKKTTDLLQVTDRLYHIKLYLAWAEFELTMLVVIGTDCTGSCKSNYHTITATMAPSLIFKVVLFISVFLTFFPHLLYLVLVSAHITNDVPNNIDSMIIRARSWEIQFWYKLTWTKISLSRFRKKWWIELL